MGIPAILETPKEIDMRDPRDPRDHRDPRDYRDYRNHRSGSGDSTFFIGILLAGFCALMFSAGFIEQGVNSIPPAYRKERVKPERQPRLAPLEYDK